GDVNGDDKSDLILCGKEYESGTQHYGVAYVVFSTLIDDVGTSTGNNKPFSTSTNYNIAYRGAASAHYLTWGKTLTVGDINGDSNGDLVLGAYGAGNNGDDSGSVWVMFSTLIDDVGTSTGNYKPLSTSTDYNIRYDGGAAGEWLIQSGILAIGDVNGDSNGDLILGAYRADNNGTDSGSAWVMFSTLIDDVGTSTGNNKPLSTTTNYNIRYDGGSAGDQLTFSGLAIGDVNGSSNSDLVLGASSADNNGTNSGSVWVMFSTLIDDVGTSTGNNKLLSTTANYNIRYDGGEANDKLTYDKTLTIGDINGDSNGDLVLGTYYAGNNGVKSGSAWVMFSTLIDDVGTSTGNNKPLSTTTNYNIRYDGGGTGDRLTEWGSLAIGDINGDSKGDLVLGAAYADNIGTDSGSAYVMFSQPTATSAPIKAYESNDTAVTASSPGTEAGPAVLSKVYSDDSNRWRTALSATGSGYDSQVFKFQPDFSGISTPKITISWNGYGDASATGTNTYLNIWNFTSSAWEQLDSGDCDTDCDLSGFKTGTNYKDGSDYVWAWVKADNEFSAPVISDISSGTPTFQDATITWSTDISADAMVGFHTSSHSGGGWDDYPWQDNDGGETGNTSHSIYLGGLADGTTYYYRVRSADADGDFAVSSENSFTTATLSCPWIWSWNGEKFIWDDEANPNFIMREFKGDDYSRLPNLKLVNGEYKIKITEYLPETSYFDKVELVNIKHPEHTEIYTGHDNKLYTIQKKTAPVSAFDGAGNDLLGEIIKDDEVYWNYFEISGNPWVDDDGDGLADSTEECSKYNYLYLEFPKPKEAQRVNIISKQKVTSAWSWQQVYGFLVDHPDIREKSLGGVIELLNHSPFYYTIWNGIDWTGETAIMEFPGNKASTVVYPADISEIKTETLKVRIMTDPYAGKMLLDYIAVDYSEPSDFTVERIKPLNNEKLLEIDDDCVVLDHDEIEIVFKDNNEGQDMPDGYKITHFLDVNGYHEDYPLYDIEIDEATFYKLAKYDRDYTSRFWRPKWTEYEKMRALSIDNFQS
ncbi:MAG: hypothetical protein U9Q67_01835, partial [Patescibacteria group bacterium]|nr:hypothetical protein [Patescibacteria group bacterium]